MKRLALFIFAFLLILAPAFPAIYYVDYTTGDDGDSGLTEALAWKTISKVNGASFSAGDSVLFKRGEVWRETLAVPGSGGAGNLITFGAYGTGADPVIKGSDLKNTSGDWTDEGSNLWYLASITVDPGILAHDGTLGKRELLKASLGTAWDYWWDDPNDRFYVYSVGNPTTQATNVEIGARDNCIDPQGTSYISLSNLDLRHSRANALAVLWGSAGWVIDACTFLQISKYGLQFHNGGSGTVTDCTFTDWGVIDGHQYAIQAIGNGATETGPVDVTDCVFTLTQQTNVTECMPVMSDDGGWVRTFSDNTVTGGGFIMGSGVTIWKPASTATTITIEGNTISGVSSSGIMVQELEDNAATPTVSVRDNWIENVCLADTADTEALRVRNYTSSCDVTVAYNIINGTLDGTQVHHGIQNKGADGTKIWNNVIYGCDNGIEVNDESADHSTGLDVRNNIVFGNRSYGLNLAADNTITTWGYNCWYDNDSGALNGKAAGTGDVTDDPLVVDAGTDFKLQSESPCRDAGADVGLRVDYVGNPVLPFAEMGAYALGLDGFSFYKEITISHAQVDADLTNFPVYVPIVSDANIGAVCQADGDDVQFSNSDNTATLTFERLAGFAVESGQASGDFYVLVPLVAGASDTKIRCYYGDAGATSASSPENTFLVANGWAAHWHLEENGSGYLDATSNNNDSIGQDAPTRVTGLVGGYAQEFVAANHNWIKVADNASLDVTTIFSGQALVKRTSDAEAPFVNKGNSFTWTVTAAGKNQITLRSGGAADYVSTTGTDDTNQHYFGFTADSAYVHHYVDATADADQSQTTNGVSNANALYLGSYDEYESLDSNIIIDEVRIYAGVLSDAWHKFTYYNWQEGHASGNELTWSAEQSPDAFVPVVIIIN